MSQRNRCYERSRHLWEEIQENADAFHEPGRFTTFPAYEWTATPRIPGGAVHLHRNVIFNGRDVPAWGGSAVEMENRPERLWKWLAGACTGECRAVAIPHNTNLAGGLAFTEAGWRPHTPDILRLRARAEPLVEIHQIKGNSECFRGLGTTDEECNFETYRPACEPGQGGANCINASDMVRNALKEGLRLEAGYGVNPYKLGFIASPDDHQKIQVVKGWVDAEGEIRERVFDAVCADGLEPDAETRRCPDNGAMVDLSDCSYSAGLGAAELSATWSDPEFDPALRAFYYVRALENPTCRWTSHRALARGIPIPDPAVIKERAWSSPIWYTPAGE